MVDVHASDAQVVMIASVVLRTSMRAPSLRIREVRSDGSRAFANGGPRRARSNSSTISDGPHLLRFTNFAVGPEKVRVASRPCSGAHGQAACHERSGYNAAHADARYRMARSLLRTRAPGLRETACAGDPGAVCDDRASAGHQ